MRLRLLTLFSVLVLVMASCTDSDDATSITATTALPSTTRVREVVPTTSTVLLSEFRQVVDGITASLLALQPELVTELGAGATIGFDEGYLLNDLSLRGQQELASVATEGLAQLAALETGDISDHEQLSVAILRWYLTDLVTMAEFAGYEIPVNFIRGAHA